jgi:hypothetical protein
MPRILAQHLSERLRQPVVIENRAPGRPAPRPGSARRPGPLVISPSFVDGRSGSIFRFALSYRDVEKQ